jgi:hypothetical protein
VVGDGTAGEYVGPRRTFISVRDRVGSKINVRGVSEVVLHM